MPKATSNQNLLVHTKLRRPRAAGQLVRRPRLLDLLHGGMALPLTVVSAPAGYGKSTLVGLWLDEVDVPWAWYSTDDQDNSLDIFAAYLAAALADAYPGCGATLQSLLQSPTTLQPQRLADIFAGELEALPGELLVVIDDYHAITDPIIHSFMSSVIQNAPAGVHFVLLMRSDPPLKLARLRAGQQVLEVRSTQLRFTQDETRELMRRILGDLATDETVTVFVERTEGWAAGIYLAATSMRSSSNGAAFVQDFARSNQIIVDYLVSEVLEQLSERQRTLLLRVAILPRICASLCDVLLLEEEQGADDASLFDWLRSMNLFLIALDDEGVWYRFHHLFVDILRHRLRLELDDATIARLHGAASRWFEANGLIGEAMRHALSAGDPIRAARLVEACTDNLLNGENWRTLERRLALLPPEQTRRPALLVARGWVEQFRYRPDSVLALAQEAGDGLERNAEEYSVSDADAIRGGIYALHALAHMYAGRWESALGFAERALAAIPAESAYVRGVTEFAYIHATTRSGQPGKAIEQANLWLRQQSGKPDARSLRLLLALCSVYYDQMKLEDLRAVATSYLQLAQQARRPVSVAWSSFLLGFVHYQRNELSQAEIYFSEVVHYPHEAHTWTVVDSWIGLCLILQVQGKHDEAHRQARELRTFLLEGGLVELTEIADALAAYVQLLAGRSAGVSDRYVQDLPHQLGMDCLVAPFHVWALGSILSDQRDRQVSVAAKLAELRTLLATDYVPRRLLEIELLDALLQATQGDHRRALDAVHRAVAIAEPGGALRFFVDMGPDLKPYLHQLADQGVAPEFIARILSALAAEKSETAGQAKSVALLTNIGNAALGPDMLTNREIDVLLLLERRLSNKEIAELLFISPRTVKRHTIAIYSKLRVDNRRAAVAYAKTLGLMPAV